MRSSALYIAVAITVAASCTDDGARSPVEADLITAPAFSHATPIDTDNFRAHAHGGEEVPPVETKAQGQAVFQLSDDGEEISYTLIVANIMDVTQAHIHRAPTGETGDVVAWLYPSGPPSELIPGRFQGVLAEGVIGSADLVGPLAGMDLAALVEDLRTGNAYVNVHTLAHPPGEIRGQIH